MMVAKALTLAWLAAGTAMAQPVDDSIPPGPRDVDTFRIERDGTIAPPTPTPAPTPAPVPAPVPTPAPEPTPEVVLPVPPAPAPNTITPTSQQPRRVQRRVSTPRADIASAAPAVTPPLVDAPLPDTPTAPIDTTIATPIATEGPQAVTSADPTVAEPPAEDARSSGVLWIAAIAAGVLALLSFLYMRRRRGRGVVYEETQFVEEQMAVPEADVPGAPFENPATDAALLPLTATSLAAAPLLETAPPTDDARPRLELVFTPAAASATDQQATVDFALTVTNGGDAPARNVRMEARLFAMGDDHDAVLTRFFADPLAQPVPVADTLVPGVGAELRAKVTLPRSAVRPIQVADRVLFVPLVAFNLLYDWGGDDVRTGQTAMSYVVGRETNPPAAKMAPFRLDQGPRIYRQVGQRAHQSKRVA